MPGANEEQVKLNVGESTNVQLKGLASAGYVWNYKIDNNQDCLNISKNYVNDGKTSQAKMGTSSDEVFTIKAIKKGNVNIKFLQSRSWEPNEDPVKEKNIMIIIQ